MAVKTKLKVEEAGKELEGLDELDSVYVEDMKNSGLDASFLEQFKDLTRLLEEEKDKKS